MSRCRRSNPSSTTYLSDLAFLLIVFFVLLAGSTTVKVLQVQVPPAAQSAAVLEPTQRMSVLSCRDGSYMVGDTIATPEGLRPMLQGMQALDIMVEQGTAWEHVTTLIALCSELDVPLSLRMVP